MSDDRRMSFEKKPVEVPTPDVANNRAYVIGINAYKNGIPQLRTAVADGVRSFRSITINPRRYLDRESNQWKDAGSYHLADLPALIFSLQKAQEFVYETPLPGEPAADGESPVNAGDDLHF